MEKDKDQNIVPAPIAEEMQRAYLDYAMSVIVSRALPDVRDGLKPVQRRIIYAMYDQGMVSTSRYQKCAAVVGEVLKKYHPHGDTAVYDALARMAQNFSLRYMLVDGQGNFGSVDGDSPAAMRYTECRLSKISDDLLSDIDKDTVEYRPNYSGDYNEPSILPSIIPNLLLNGASGIAVGMATNIPAHNLGELVDALSIVISKADPENLEAFRTTATTEEILTAIKGPDFPTGGIIYNQKEIHQMYASGKGRIVTRAKTAIEEEKNGKYSIVATEIPFQTNKAELIAHIADLVKDKKIDGISDLRDESDKSGMRIVIELKREAQPQRILNLLFKHTELQKSFNANMVALVNNEPKLLSLREILEEFVKHRQIVVVRRTKFLLKKAQEREHILQGLKIALDHIDEVIKTIRNSKDVETAKTQLMEKFKLSEIQATAILEMQLRRLAALERQKIEDELKEILKTISELKDILANPQRVLDIIKEELLKIKEKYGDARKTKVIKGDLDTPEEEDLIKEEDVIVTITTSGYIKRLSADSYKRQGRGGKGVKGSGLKEEDNVYQIITTSTHDTVLFFSNLGRVYALKAWDIPEAGRTAKGTAIINLLNLSQTEKITAILDVSKNILASKELYLFMTTKNGTVKKTQFAEFENIRSSGIVAIKLDKEDTLEWVHLTKGTDEILLTTRNGMSIRFSEKDVRPMGRVSTGVRAIRLKPADAVVGSNLIAKDDRKQDYKLMAVSQNGYGKRSNISEYKVQSRGGSGLLTYKVTEKTGNLIASKIIESKVKDLIITSAKGQIIRLGLENVPILGRNTQGVRLIKMDSGDTVTSFTPLENPEEEV